MSAVVPAEPSAGVVASGPPAAGRRAALIFVFVTVLIDMLAFGMITHQVGPEVQGRIQGALMSLISLAGVVAPPIFASSFAYFIGPSAPAHLPGVPFLIAGLMMAIALLGALGRRRAASPG